MSHYDKIKIQNENTKAAAGALGHVASYESAGHISDLFSCSCGWKSRSYWDGAEYAFDEWLKHARQVIEAGQAHLPLKTP